MARNSILCFALLGGVALNGCATDGDRSLAPVATAAQAPLHRGQIIPLVDHHQHIFGTDLVDAPTALLPAVDLPADIDQLLRNRERVAGTRNIEGVFSADAQALNIFFDTDHWVTGGEVANVVEQHGAGLRFVPNSFHSSGSAAFVSGIVHADAEGEYDKHFTLGLRRGAGGRWLIVSEAITNKVQNPFRQPLDAKTLIARLDDAGIRRATVLSTAFWLASPRRRGVENERARVAAANDWVVEQTGLYPDRLIPFCGLNPISDYAVAEMQRCSQMPRVRGIKMHFANARIDLKNAEHLHKVRAFFRAANEQRMAIVVHLWPVGQEGPDYSRIFIEQVLSEAPDIPVQIAHLGSGAPPVFDQVLGVFADAFTARDPRVRNLYFDFTEVILDATNQPTVEAVAQRMRQIGLERMLFGSDTPLPNYRPPPVLAWAAFRRRIPLTDEELSVIANNVAPYLREGAAPTE